MIVSISNLRLFIVLIFSPNLFLGLPDEGAICNSEMGDEDELRQNMDLHQMISENITLNHESPPVSADQVIDEIDQMMQVCPYKCG